MRLDFCAFSSEIFIHFPQAIKVSIKVTFASEFRENLNNLRACMK